MSNPKGYIVPLALAVVIGFGVWWQASASMHLREEQARLAAEVTGIARLKALNTQHQATALSTTELQKLNEAAAEASALRSRISKLKEEVSRPSMGTSEAPKKSEERWRNLGQATPHDTVQSIIWAATGGEVDALVTMLTYDADSRAAADDLFAAIPPESRALFPTADKLVATLISGRLPADFTEAQIIEQFDPNAYTTQAKVRLSRSARSTDAPREVTFSFQRTGSAWRLVVPKSVIAEFQRTLNKN